MGTDVVPSSLFLFCKKLLEKNDYKLKIDQEDLNKNIDFQYKAMPFWMGSHLATNTFYY